MMESQSQMRQLQEKIDELESRLRNKDEEYSRLQASSTALERVGRSSSVPSRGHLAKALPFFRLRIQSVKSGPSCSRISIASSPRPDR